MKAFLASVLSVIAVGVLLIAYGLLVPHASSTTITIHAAGDATRFRERTRANILTGRPIRSVWWNAYKRLFAAMRCLLLRANDGLIHVRNFYKELPGRPCVDRSAKRLGVL